MLRHMAMADRILGLCDLLLGAAYADEHLDDKERDEVRALLEDLGGELTTETELRISQFDPKTFDVKATAAGFRDEPEDDRKKILFLVSAVIEADEEIDFLENDYLCALADALGLPKSALDGLTVDVETEELKETFQQVKRGPPPPPKPGAKAKSDKSGDVDVDLD
jgi:uncharacterized membrane protein YebE (DUF533 family)